ncbi:MAG: GatB/YqeY domain-containing protein, partial [Actinomycetota bacterium]|nr:GatB/YqeY domain-containing protein [Actinomycetota bacterium]
MGTLKERLRTDLTASMKARDELARASLRMALAAVQTAEVSGDQAR